MSVRGDPLEGHLAAGDQIAQHVPRQIRLGLKRQTLRDTAVRPALAHGVTEPTFMNVQPPVQHGVALATRIHGEHAFLRIGHLADRPTILCVIRRNPSTESDSFRPPNPVLSVH